MRRILRLFFLLIALVIVGGIVVVALVVSGNLEVPFSLPFDLSNAATPVTISMDAGEPPSITSTDNCTLPPSAASVGVEQRQSRSTLPNGRPFPGVGPRNINRPNRPERNQVLIQFIDSATQQERNAYLQSIGARSRRSIDRLNTLAVTLPPNTDATSLPADPIVVLIEPDYIAEAAQTPIGPNDARYGEQWGLPVIGLPAAWSQIASVPSTVTVAVIDSGICPAHPDLAGRIVSGFDFVDDDADPTDVFGHGCGVAGVIAANGNNQIGIAGVAPNSRIMPLRTLDENGIGNYSDIAAAIVYAADNNAQIINLSLAGPQYSQVIATAVDYAINRGVIIIAASGNNGTEGAWYPAALPAVVAVGSIDPNLERSIFSNFGPDVAMLAPGRDILTTSLNGDYEMMTGTSFATPHVTGIAALALAYNLPLNTENGIVYLYPPDSQPQCP